MNFKHLIFMSSSILMASCGGNAPKEDGKAHFLPSDFDTTSTIGNDFYQYSNYAWMQSHPIPGDKSRVNTFDVLNDENQDRLKAIVEEACQKRSEAGSNAQKIGDYYSLAMDTVRRDSEGVAPVQFLIDKIEQMNYDIKSPEFAKEIAYFHSHLGNPFFATGATPDAENSTMNICLLWQSGVMMPDRDYYFDESDKGKELIEGYKLMLSELLELVGKENGKDRAEQVFEFEKKMAGLMNTRVQNRNPLATHNKMTFQEVCNNYPQFDWMTYYQELNCSPADFNVGQPTYFKGIFDLLGSTDKSVLQDYLLCNTFIRLSNFLSEDFFQATFKFYSKQLSGVGEKKPLWRRSLTMVSMVLGEPLGQLFVEKHFNEDAKKRMVDLIEHLREAFGQRIDNLTWMSDTTKAFAKDKLSAIKIKVGYPDVWEDYSGATVDPSLSLVENYINLTYFAAKKEMSEIGQPVNTQRWYMTPQTVNAYYNPQGNEIVFPAGILQPPFFYAEGDDAVNYGAIGVVIGHEMTHGFDDSGRQYDKDGNLKDWWTATDSENFKLATNRLKERFSKVVVIDDLHCNGELTLGENIADLGGLNIAHQAFLNTLNPEAEEQLIDGQTYDQRFLFAYSRIWAGNYRDENLRNQVKTDPHANGKYRVNVQLPMLDFFYTAFGIQESDAMYEKEEDRIVIW